MPNLLSRNGLCDFRISGTRRPEHRLVLVYHLYLWLWHNNWNIPIKRLKRFTYKQLMGMLNRINDGESSWMLNNLLHEHGYDPGMKGLPPAERPTSPQLPLFSQPTVRRARAS